MTPSATEAARLRPFRAAAYGIHVTVTAAFCLFVTWNVVRSVRAMSPSVPLRGGALASTADCTARANGLWRSLDDRRRALSEVEHGLRQAHQDWSDFRIGWLEQLRRAQAECGVNRPERLGLGAVFHDLDRLENLYTTHAVQYVGEIGPTVGRLRADLKLVDAAPPGANE